MLILTSSPFPVGSCRSTRRRPCRLAARCTRLAPRHRTLRSTRITTALLARHPAHGEQQPDDGQHRGHLGHGAHRRCHRGACASHRASLGAQAATVRAAARRSCSVTEPVLTGLRSLEDINALLWSGRSPGSDRGSTVIEGRPDDRRPKGRRFSRQSLSVGRLSPDLLAAAFRSPPATRTATRQSRRPPLGQLSVR